MTRSITFAAVLLASLVATQPVVAQSLSRAQVQMDRDTFLSMLRWDELAGQWVMRSGMALPKGIKSRAEVMSMVDEFLRMNRWNEQTSQWESTGGKPRDMSTLSRDQLHMETTRFLMMHRFDELAGKWVSRAVAG